MGRAPIQSVIHHLQALVVSPDTAGLADGALLERFLSRRDEAAFEALVRRHGPMVLGVCRRVLPNPHDAEDAFQATFLVLVRKAATIARRELLGNWLYGVAYQTARAARAAAGRRRAKEAKAMPRQPTPEADLGGELLSVLDQELSGLPDKYRIPVVLCDIQGKSRRDAAQALGLPEGTLSSRLARARALLARRLARRGLTLSAGALAAALAPEATAAALPPSLIGTTVKVGVLALAGPLTTGTVSPPVAALSERVIKAMFLAKLKVTLAGLVVGGILALGAGKLASWQLLAARPAQGEQDPAPAATAASREDAKPLLQQALETARAITDPRQKLLGLIRIAAVQNETHDPAGARKTCQAALEVAGGVPNGRSKVLALALELAPTQAEAGDRAGVPQTLRQARQAADAIEDANQRGNALLDIVRAQASVGDYEGALQTAKDCGEYEAAALQSLAWPLRKPDRPTDRKALREAVARMKTKSESNQRQYLPALAAAQVEVGDLEGALQTVEPLGTWKRIGLRAIAVAQARTGDTTGALKTARDIQQQQLRAEALLAVAGALAKAGDRAAARPVLEEVLRLVDAMQKGDATRPGAALESGRAAQIGQLQGRIALTQFRLGDATTARRTAFAIQSGHERAWALLEIGIAEAAAGKRAEAREVLSLAAAVAESVRPSEDPSLAWADESAKAAILRGHESAKAATLRVIAEQQAKVGDVSEALRTVESIATDQERETALGLIVPLQAAAGDVKEALRTLARIKDGSWKASALEGLVQAQVRAGDERGALAVVAEQTSPALKVSALLGMAKGRAGEKGDKSQPSP
jgi:RNA polymerase sigma factor (sigma-70 family)